MFIADKESYLKWVKEKAEKEWAGYNINLFKKLNQEYQIADKIESKTQASVVALKQAWFNTEVENGAKCAKCGTDKHPTLDHIVPVMIVEQFGVDERRAFMPDNYQILCKKCNTFKSHRLDFTNPKTKEILLELIKEI